MRFVRFDPAPALAGIGIVSARDSGSLAIGMRGPILGDGEMVESFLGRVAPEARRRDRYGLLALLAAREALEEAGLLDEPHRAERCGVMIGTTHASSERNGRYAEDLAHGDAALSPNLFVRTTSGAAAADIAFAFRMAGPGQTFASGWTAGAEALAAAARAVSTGAADLMLAGGVEVPGPLFALAGRFTTEAAALAVVAPGAAPGRPRVLAYGRGHDGGDLASIAADLSRDCGLTCGAVVEANDPHGAGTRRSARAAAPIPASGASEVRRLAVGDCAGEIGAAGVVIGCVLAAEAGGNALVVARDPAGDVAALLLG